MHRQNIVFISLLLILGVAIGATSYAKGWRPLGIVSVAISRVTHGPSQGLVAETNARAAPEISGGFWINSGPQTLKSLRGRVVLIEFWTFGCFNCRNTLPSVKKWDARYRDKGLTTLGVHTPEFDEEKNIDTLRREVAELDIQYTVVSDNDYATWNAFGVYAWPTLFVLDKQGRVRWKHVGEGAYDETEEVIKKLLAEQQPSAVTNPIENSSR